MARRKKQQAHPSPLIRLVGLEAAAAMVSMAGAPAMAAHGDLDPSFGDVGRQSGIEAPSYFSNLWSVDVQGDDSVLFGGGGEYDYYGSYEDYFIGRLLPNGAPDTSFAVATLKQTAVYDTTLQSDGKVIGVGTARQPDGVHKLLVFRLQPDGALDTGFGLGGLVVLSNGSGLRDAAYSVILDPDGRIVVAGQRGDSLLVARLLANGILDAGFGAGGIYLAPQVLAHGVQLASAAGSGYRITGAVAAAGGMGSDCTVVGLTGTGVPDPAFGNAGLVTRLSPSGGNLYCSALAVQPDGRILYGGMDADAGGYVGRLLPNGATDTAFDTDVVPGQFTAVTALAVGNAGSIFVTGTGRTVFSGALLVGLLADGTLDAQFGRAGATSVDVKSRRAGFTSIEDMKVVNNDALVVAGNTSSGGKFVARLLGKVAGGSPGVLSMERARFVATEQDGRAVLSVHRTGGSAGAIAVTYTTHQLPWTSSTESSYAPGANATETADFATTTGRLTWADGDLGEREIVVPIVSDTSAEDPEFFEVVLESPEGGAGLGAWGADVEIAGTGYPVGIFTLPARTLGVTEGAEAMIRVSRNFYSQGAVSVTVRVLAGGTATPGQDFSTPGSTDWHDGVLTWADGEMGEKVLPVRIAADGTTEPVESFTLELASPTGGAALGEATQMSVWINDPPPPPPVSAPSSSSGRGGGGAFGWLGAMLFGLGGALRRQRIRSR